MSARRAELPRFATSDEAAQLAGKLQNPVANQPFDVEGHEIYVTTTGICMYPDGGCTSATLIKSAGCAMYQGKETGCRIFQFFTYAADLSKYSEVEIARHLRKAIERRELHLYYQPRVPPRPGSATRRIINF